MVQAQGARREHRPRPRVARARAPPPGADVDPGGRAWTGSPTSRSSYNHDTVDDFFAAIGYGAIERPDRWSCGSAWWTTCESTLPTVAPPQPARTGGVRVKGVGDLLVRFAKLLSPDPGRPDRRVHHPRQGRHRPPHVVSHGPQRARGVAADRCRVGGGAGADATRSRSASRRTTGPGLLSDMTQVDGREQGQHPGGERRRSTRTTPRSWR